MKLNRLMMKRKINLFTVMMIVVLFAASCPDVQECPKCETCIDSIECYDFEKYDSLVSAHHLLNESWKMLNEILDSVIKDTAWLIPQCTLCYESIDSVNGEQYYVGYNGRYYKVVVDSIDLKQVFINWVDTTIFKYVVTDSNIFVDSIITNFTGEKILWAHTLCDKYMTDSCESKLVLGHVLTRSMADTDNLTALRINAVSLSDVYGPFPDFEVFIDGVSVGSNNAIYIIDKSYSDINSITIKSNTEGYVQIKTISFNNHIVNSPEGWNVVSEDNIQYIGNSYFYMQNGSSITYNK